MWLTASPLWRHFSGDREGLGRPAILRFETDDFMEELFALVGEPPARDTPSPLGDKIATFRRFGERPDGAPDDWATKRSPTATLKLFQPVHGHFHVVAASLVCDVLGRPDHTAPPAQVGFVMRRLTADRTGELAWVPMTAAQKVASAQRRAAAEGRADPANGIAPHPTEDLVGDESGHVWKPVPAGSAALVEEEVVLPGFAVPCAGEREQPRKMWAALVPASSPELRLMTRCSDTTVTMSNTFVLRAVLHKPSCPPARRFVTSDRSEPFRIASFMDPDAPARAAVVPLPKIPSVRELLKRLPKKTKFMAPSPVQINGDAATPKDMVGAELPGMICSMSIPIITLCAYILLSIILSILNFVFWWLPFVKVCFPLPSQLAPEEE